MYLRSVALIFFIDWDFSLGHMSMNLSSFLAALSSPMVSSVTGTTNQVASPHGCILGLPGPEPSGVLNYPGQHLQLPPGVLADQASSTKKEGSNFPNVTSENALNQPKTLSSVHRSLSYSTYP